MDCDGGGGERLEALKMGHVVRESEKWGVGEMDEA